MRSVIQNVVLENQLPNFTRVRQLILKKMNTIIKKVIRISEFPNNLQTNEVFIGHKIHTYAEFHIDDSESDDLTTWIVNKYPELKNENSFLIHIDKTL